MDPSAEFDVMGDLARSREIDLVVRSVEMGRSDRKFGNAGPDLDPSAKLGIVVGFTLSEELDLAS